MFTTELTHGNVRKIVADSTSNKVHLITPIFPLGKVTNHKELIKKWGVSTFVDKVYGHLQRAIGKADLTVMKTLDNHFAHPTKEGADQWQNYTYQSHYSIGKLAHVFRNPDSNQVMWGAYDITDPTGKAVALEYMDSYNKGLVPLYTSSQIVNSASENPLSIENFDLMHTTLTDDPSFGKELTKVGAVCQGDTQQCVLQIRTASNTTENVNVMFIGKEVEIHHKECPFCLGTALRDLFNKNSSLKLNKASNLQMPDNNEQKQVEGEKKTPDVIAPDADQKKDSSTFDPKAMADEITARVTAEFNKQQVAKAEEQAKADETKKDEAKKNIEATAETLKPFNIEDSPQYKAMMKRLEKAEAAVEKNKVDSDKLKSLEAEQNFNKIGYTLAKYEYNFVNPETGKADTKAFDKAFEYLRNTGWSVEDIETHMSILSPFGAVAHKQQQEMSVIQKAANNYGVPKLDAAFEKGKETHSASNVNQPSGLSLVDSILRENEA